MQGSIRKKETKDGKPRYEFVWDEPTPDGRRKQRSRTFRTRKEAEQFQTKTLHEIHSGTYVQPTTTTVGEFLETWLEATKSSVQRSTFPSYAGIVRKHLLPALGGIRLDKLEPTTVQRLYQRFLDAGAAAATVRLRHVVLHKALDQAVAWPTVARNVAEGAKLPSGNEFEADAWSADEVRAFLAATDKDPRRVLWRLGFDSGMRLCELLALGWSDVDLEGGTVSVRRKLVRGAIGGWEIKEGAKSKAGRRTIVLLPDTVAALRGHRAAQNERRLRLGADWRDLGVVIDRGDGDHERPGAIQQALARAVERAGLPPLTPHGMRHTMATVMAAAGVHPSVVQARLGHSSPEITLARYTHVSADMQRDGADQLARILAGSPDAAVRSA